MPFRQVFADTEILFQVSPVDCNAFDLSGGNTLCRFAADRGKLALKDTHAGLTGIAGNDFANCVVAQAKRGSAEPMPFKLLGYQMMVAICSFSSSV